MTTEQLDYNKILADYSESLDEMREMIQILGQDCREHYEVIKENSSQTHRRAYVRSVFAFIEGVLHRTKITTLNLGLLLGNISAYELIILESNQLKINEKGDVVLDKPLYPPFLNNVKFTFKIFSKTMNSSFKLNIGGQGWQKLCEAVKIRDRLMHPKGVLDLQVSGAEIEAAKKTFEWFLISHVLCTNYAQKAIQATTATSVEDAAKLDAHIQHLEADLAAKGN